MFNFFYDLYLSTQLQQMEIIFTMFGDRIMF